MKNVLDMMANAPHNYELDDNAIKRLIEMVAILTPHEERTPLQIVEDAIHLYGGTVAMVFYFTKEEDNMKHMISDMFYQLGMSTVDRYEDGIRYVDTFRKYVHYDKIEPFTKLNSFKGIGISKTGTIEFQFIDG